MKPIDADQERWLEISVKLPAEFAEPVTHLFSLYGDGRVFVSQIGDWDADDPDAQHKSSDDVQVFCYLNIDDTIEQRKGMIGVGIRLLTQLTDVKDHQERHITADQWANQSFPTIRVADRIVISPWSIEQGIPEERRNEDIQVFLAPGLAFGTGNHPTTRLCLKQILDDADLGNINESRVLDIGCGSGILAIVALKLGARHAWCVDTDQTAIRATKDNLLMSRVADNANVLQGTVPNPKLHNAQFDYIFANITSRVLNDLATYMVDLVKQGGVILTSGILEQEASSVQDAFLVTGSVSVSDKRQEGDWVMLKIVKTTTQ